MYIIDSNWLDEHAIYTAIAKTQDIMNISTYLMILTCMKLYTMIF